MSLNARNAVFNMIGVSLNTATSLVFSIIVTRLIGLEEAGVFAIGFSFACILFILAGYVTRVYQVTDTAGSFSPSDYFFHHGISFMLTVAVSVLLCVGMRYSGEKAAVLILLCAYRGLEGFSEFFYALLQKEGQLFRVGISYSVKAVGGTVCFFLVVLLTRNLIWACLALTACSLAVMLLYDLPKSAHYFTPLKTLSAPSLLCLTKLCFVPFCTSLLSAYFVNAARYTVDALLPSSDQAIFTILLLPATLMALLSTVYYQAAVVRVSALFSEERHDGLGRYVRRLALGLLSVSVLAGLVLHFAAGPLLQLLYGVELTAYSRHFDIVLLGGAAYCMQMLFSQLLVIFRKMRALMYYYLLPLLIPAFAGRPLVRSQGLLGACWVYALIMLLLCICLGVYTLRCVDRLAGQKG